MTFTPAELSRIRRHPHFPQFIKDTAYRFQPDAGRWPSLLPTRPVATIYDAAVLRWNDPSWQIPPVVYQCVDDLVVNWKDTKRFPLKDVSKDVMPPLADAYWLAFKGNQKISYILETWRDIDPTGFSPGPTLHSVVMANLAFGANIDAERIALTGYAGMPGILEWFSPRWMHGCGATKWETPEYNLKVSYAPLMWLADRYIANGKLVGPELAGRYLGFKQLPANLLLSDGLHPRLGDDLMHDDNPPVKAPALYLSKHLWAYSGSDAASKWLRWKAWKEYGGYKSLRDMLVKVNTEEPALPAIARKTLTLMGDDGRPLFSKWPGGCRWHQSPWKKEEGWGEGHTIGLLPAEFITEGGREFYVTTKVGA